jgi:NAD(P)-dependent dehydrogenase (short-subunit alcohol dehydrogenase family)
MFNLAHKNALVTGGSRGIGRGIVRALAAQGANVAINYHSNHDEAIQLAQELTNQGRNNLVLQADVSKVEEIKVMFGHIKEQWQTLDILVNNAGIVFFSEFETTTEEQWDQILDTNLKSQFFCIQEAVKLMKPGSKVINIASIASGGVGVGFPLVAPYTASKGGVVALTESLALDLAANNINVNCVAPGVIESDMTKDLLENDQSRVGTLAKIPKGRAGKPEDIGAAVAFLAADEADYITGAVLYVDGGWLTS